MDTSLESLHLDGRKCGAIVRRRTPREVRTLVCYRAETGVVRTDSSLQHDADPRHWSSYTYRGGDHSVSLQRTGGTILGADGARLDAPADTLPSQAATAVLEDMLAGSATEVEFHYLVEGADEPPHPAHYSVGNPETLTLPDGRTELFGVAELFVDEQPVHTYWFDSHEIVATAQGDLRTYRVPTVEELVDGLDDEVADAIRTFCG